MNKMKKLFLVGLFAIAFLLCTGTAYSAYYGIYDIYDQDEDPEEENYAPTEYPGTEHFDWVNRSYTYNSGTDNQFTINVILNAPDNWTNEGENDYTGYRKIDYGTYFGFSTVWADGTQSFDNVYSYFYQIDNTGSESVTSISIPYDPASVSGYGYVNGIGQDLYPIDTNNNKLNVEFNPGYTGTLDPGEKSDWFFMTSENWWGWQPLTYNGDTSATGSTYLSSLHDSPDGMIPAPNPEASTVALYIVGLIGMGTLYYRKKKIAEMEV